MTQKKNVPFIIPKGNKNEDFLLLLLEAARNKLENSDEDKGALSVLILKKVPTQWVKFTDNELRLVAEILIAHKQQALNSEFRESIPFERRVHMVSEEFSKAKRWTIADFSRLFIVLLIPVGMIFAQYYFWADINEFSRENIQLFIGAIEIATGLVLWYSFHKVFAIRSERIKLSKAGYDILSRQINTEQKIKLLEEKATKWEFSDSSDWILIFFVSGGIIYLGFSPWFLEKFQLPYFPEYTSLGILLIGVILFIWLMVKSRIEKKEVCAAKISELQKFL